MKDEIIDEVRRIREAYVAEHGYYMNAIFEDLKARESASASPGEDLAEKRGQQSRADRR
jgi:hypothetical protein